MDDYFSKGKFKLFNSLFHSVYLVFPVSLFSIADLFAVRYLWSYVTKMLCCDAALGRHLRRLACLSSHVLRAYCNFESKKKRTRLLYLGDSQIKKVVIKGIAEIMQRFRQSVSSGMHDSNMGIGPDLKI